ncbi:hypothetical protein BO70DRAFT_400355 [Aspergillus heteromorphus CBS 117.55]|uniref:Uncharacterized protein n=1 Tax=Aspergillus heteromorphus CBS 117.55 TaxID=1448321 RepID=A0A317V5X0_9EURO|nr:uncharacterized protein BO70DRAFT_400355 [Aspergillus heteromorphus CBS 117.55]PWY68438.1 hypothetical protein BO70DRAFT_400355 [Aspergillus heteromorphus CBS 117.55]
MAFYESSSSVSSSSHSTKSKSESDPSRHQTPRNSSSMSDTQPESSSMEFNLYLVRTGPGDDDFVIWLVPATSDSNTHRVELEVEPEVPLAGDVTVGGCVAAPSQCGGVSDSGRDCDRDCDHEMSDMDIPSQPHVEDQDPHPLIITQNTGDDGNVPSTIDDDSEDDEDENENEEGRRDDRR